MYNQPHDSLALDALDQAVQNFALADLQSRAGIDSQLLAWNAAVMFFTASADILAGEAQEGSDPVAYVRHVERVLTDEDQDPRQLTAEVAYIRDLARRSLSPQSVSMLVAYANHAVQEARAA